MTHELQSFLDDVADYARAKAALDKARNGWVNRGYGEASEEASLRLCGEAAARSFWVLMQEYRDCPEKFLVPGPMGFDL